MTTVTANSKQGRETPLPYVIWGWIGSGILHVIAVLLLVYFLRSFGQPGGMGQESLDYHSVGLYASSSPGETMGDDKTPSPLTQMEKSIPVENPPLETTMPTPTQVTNPLEQPNENMESPSELDQNVTPNRIGVGEMTSHQSVGQSAPVATTNTPAAAPPPPPGTVSFFSINDTGKSFVFVIDLSQSMIEDGAFDAAREQLLSALRNLKIDQKFHVVFYNRDVYEFRLQDRRAGLLTASPVHITLARNYIQSQTPSGGTNHMPALMTALGYRPEVIFFLTDALEPKLTAGELERLRLYNRGCKIHTVEFGSGPDLDRALNFLERLSSQNNGTHRYVDVKTLAQ